MNFESAISAMNDPLAEKQPQAFDRAWVRIKAPCVYRFFQREIRAENGGIDWDRITRALQHTPKSTPTDSQLHKKKRANPSKELALIS
jgi:hypothetical protein